MNTNEIIKQLKAQANPKNVVGMARFGISGKNVLGISMPYLRGLAKEINKTKPDKHKIAQELWASKIHEARILASLIEDPKLVTPEQMDTWILGFDSWDLCDQVCMNLFDKTSFAFDKCIEWSKRGAEFEKRAGFALMASYSWHRRDIPETQIIKFLTYIIKESTDSRNYVRKAVNWALRQIGKRSDYLKKEALKACDEILKIDNKTSHWIANDAIRELKSR